MPEERNPLYSNQEEYATLRQDFDDLKNLVSGHFIQKGRKKKPSKKKLKSGVDKRRNRSYHHVDKYHKGKANKINSDSGSERERQFSSDSSILDSSASDGGKTIKNYSKAIAGKVKHKIHQKEKMNLLQFQKLAKENRILKKSLKEMDKHL